jgi:hypothetical protein
MDTYYNLNGYLIFESKEGRGWVDWVESEDGGLICRVGQVKVDEDIDVAVLSKQENKFGESKFKNMAVVSKYVNSQPRWLKTKYYTRMFDTGSSGLRDCKSGEVIDPDFEYEPQPQLLIKHNYLASRQPCAICGNDSLLQVPLTLFLVDFSSSFPLRPVCRGCGVKFGADLVHLLDHFYQSQDKARD